MITELTKKQEAALKDYFEEGVRIGLATGPDMDEKLVRELTDKHRKIINLAPADHFHVYDSPEAAMAAIPSLSVSSAFYGQHDINWLMYFMFYRVECGLVEETNSIVPLFELTKHVNWFWLSSNATVVTRRPEQIHLAYKPDGIGRLHNLNDLALRYRDGTGVYALNGLRIPSDLVWVITTPAESLSAEKVMQIKNTEIRSEVLKKIGVERAFDKLDKKTIHQATKTNGGNYELIQLTFDGENQRLYLKGSCPSAAKPFFEAVPPECKTVDQALTWREWGTVEVPGGVYLEPLVRT